MSDTVPVGVIPHLVCDGAAAAIDFYTAAFGAIEERRLVGDSGKLMHAALRINGGLLMLVDAFPDMVVKEPKALGGTAVTLHLYVADAQATAARAIAAGATEIMPVQPMFWGDMYGMVADPFGHVWSIATPLGEAKSSDELQAAMATATPPAGAA